jgi:hypothetical protein
MAETQYGPNEDAEYLDIVWGILRQPIQCQECGRSTRVACYIAYVADVNLGPFCGRCHRVKAEAMG